MAAGRMLLPACRILLYEHRNGAQLAGVEVWVRGELCNVRMVIVLCDHVAILSTGWLRTRRPWKAGSGVSFVAGLPDLAL